MAFPGRSLALVVDASGGVALDLVFPGFGGDRLVDCMPLIFVRKGMPRRYPPEFCRKVLDLLKAGPSVAEVVRDLQISDQTIYNWRRQELIDTGQLPGTHPATRPTS